MMHLDRENQFAPGKLWSLGEMLKIECGRVMVEMNAHGTWCQCMIETNMAGGQAAIPLEHFDMLKSGLAFLEQFSSDVGLDVSLAAAKALRVEYEKLPRTDPISLGVAEFSALIFRTQYLQKSLMDSLDSKYVFVLPPVAHSLFAPDQVHFGQGVFDNFPSANEDIDEAAKCLALGRSTACVMHLMRAAEVGLMALASAVGVTKKNDWGSYLREITKELVARYKAAGARTPDEQFFSESADGFEHVKRAFRNPTMHVDRTYSEARAKEIFDSVKSFMALLATKLKESPDGASAQGRD